MGLMSLLRLFFALNFGDTVAAVEWTDLLTAFVIGVRFDQVVAMFVLLPLLIGLPWFRMTWTPVRWVWLAYLTATVSGITLLSLADIRFYHQFDSHLNFLAVEYIDGGPLFWNLILSDSRFTSFIAIWIMITVGCLFGFKRLYRATAVAPQRRSWVNHFVYFLVFLAACGLGIRGRVGLAPIDWGVAYFSDDRFVNQLALNGIYTLGRNLNEINHDPRLSLLDERDRYPFVDFAAGLDSVRTWLHQDGDQWLEPDRSLLRLRMQPPGSIGFQPNVVVVLMESWQAANTGVLGSGRNLTPHFDSLANRGILFDNFYANGMRTNYGLGGVLCSFPSLPGRAILKRYDALHPFVSLSEILHQRGYFNAFIYGGDLAFDNVEGFFTAKKYDRFYGQNDFSSESAFSKWGVPDHLLFEAAVDLLGRLPRPFQATILTLSNHEPFDLPDSSVRLYFDNADSSKEFNSQVYADFALGRFVKAVSSEPMFDSTLFLFTSDHSRLLNGRLALEPNNFHTPLLIYAPWLLGDSGRVVSVFGGQVDILPTLMGILGDDYTHASWGRDLLNLTPGDSGFATMNRFDRIAFIDNSYMYVELLGREPSLHSTPELDRTVADISKTHREELAVRQRRLRTYMQIADQLSTPGQGR